VIADAGTTLGSALAKVVSIVDPRVVIIGGEVGEAGELFVGPVRAEVRRSAIHVAAAGVQVVPGRLGARASALGAVALVLRELDRYVAVPE
jgi:predicted NBD/HSP70 family sugar kinase